MVRVLTPSKPTKHKVSFNHPERVTRVVSALHGMRLASRDIPVHFQTISKGVHPSQIGLHSPEYIDQLAQPFEAWEDARPLDAHDTIQTRTSFDAALEAVQCAHTGVDLLSSGEESKVLIAARPAGHHATRKHAMGFCILGGSALAAQYARDKYGWKVAILDFDYHHGNGTEDLVQDEPNIFFASTQTTKAWPLTGASGRSGKYDNILNVDLPYTARNADMIEAWTGIFDQVRKFAPDLIVVSAGVDAHHLDFLGTFRCDLELYDWFGSQIRALADDCCQGRVLTNAEGGYNLKVICEALRAYHIALEGGASNGALLGEDAYADVLKCFTKTDCYTKLPQPMAYSKDLSGRYTYRKANRRTWIYDEQLGRFCYTAPSEVQIRSRDDLVELADKLSAKDYLCIEEIIDFENKFCKLGIL